MGFQAVREALKANIDRVQEVWILKGSQRERDIKKWKESLPSESSPPILYKSLSFFDQIHSHHQGVGALMKGRPRWDWNQLGKASHQSFLALDGVTDPRNLGALLRLSWLLGVSAVFVPSHGSVSLTPSVSKVACGGTEHVPLEEGSLKKSLSLLKEKDFKVFALSPRGGKNLWNLKLPSFLVWLLGSEQKGLRPHLEDLCDEKVQIFQSVSEASLNVTTAASMALFETQRQLHFFKKNFSF